MQAGNSERLIIQKYKECIESGNLSKGIIIQPSVQDVFLWQIVFMPPTGFYQDLILTGVVEFLNYPATAPRVRFVQGLIHPCIDSDGIFDCGDQFRSWDASSSVCTLLNYIFESFVNTQIPTNPSQIKNSDAANLIKRYPELYYREVVSRLKDPPDLSKRINMPKDWNEPKESIAQILLSMSK